MTSQAIRIAIAQSIDWRILRMDEAARLGLYKPSALTDPTKWQVLLDHEGKCQASAGWRDGQWGNWVNCLPPFDESLDRIMPVIRGLTPPQQLSVFIALRMLTSVDYSVDPRDPDVIAATATAAQWSEAMLRTLNLWTKD